MKVICMECESVITEGPETPVSHGLCLDCMPGFLRQGKLTEEEIKTFMSKWRKKENGLPTLRTTN